MKEVKLSQAKGATCFCNSTTCVTDNNVLKVNETFIVFHRYCFCENRVWTSLFFFICVCVILLFQDFYLRPHLKLRMTHSYISEIQLNLFSCSSLAVLRL